MDQSVSPVSGGQQEQTGPASGGRKSRKRDIAVVGDPTFQNMPRIDSESARKHVIAYFYAAYSNCSCDACVALRPIARQFISQLQR